MKNNSSKSIPALGAQSAPVTALIGSYSDSLNCALSVVTSYVIRKLWLRIESINVYPVCWLSLPQAAACFQLSHAQTAQSTGRQRHLVNSRSYSHCIVKVGDGIVEMFSRNQHFRRPRNSIYFFQHILNSRT